MLNGKIHEEHTNTTFYYKDDKLHRIGGPAILYGNGSETWYLNGERHRIGGPAEEYFDGSKCYWEYGKRHRLDGPAIVNKYSQFYSWEIEGVSWFIHGKPIKKPEEMDTMDDFIFFLNDDEEYSLQWISDIENLYYLIKKPTGKQKRLFSMRWKI